MEYIAEQLAELIKSWFPDLAINKSVFLILVYILTSGLIVVLIKIGNGIWKNFQVSKEDRKTLPFFTRAEIREAKKTYITQRFQNVPPSKEDELIYTNSSTAQIPIINFFKRTIKDLNYKRFFFVLGDSGMGKTTFSINLFFAINKFSIFKKSKKAKIIPLGYGDCERHIKELIESDDHYNIVLILDAFDEDIDAIQNSKARLEHLMNLVKDFACVIITCRTHFFMNESQEPYALNIKKSGTRKGFYTFEKLYLSPFNDKDVERYIRKLFGLKGYFSEKKKRAINITQRIPYLSARPMLLSHIKDLLTIRNDLNNKVDYYRALINEWMEREEGNLSDIKLYSYKEDMHKFSQQVAVHIYNTRYNFGYSIGINQMEKIAKENNIDLTNFELRVRSLLNRRPSGEYKFSHKSILEYFLAIELANNYSFLNTFNFDGMNITLEFFKELVLNFDLFKEIILQKLKEDRIIFYSQNEPTADEFINNGIENLKMIDGISISNDNLEDLNFILMFDNLETLNIIMTELTNLGILKIFNKLSNLSIQNCSNIDFDSLKKLNSLLTLNLSYNSISTSVKSKIFWNELSMLHDLNLSHNMITRFDEVEVLTGLNSLNLSNNKVTHFDIPSRLKNLDLSNNELDVIKLGDWIQIRNIDLSGNKLVNIEIGSEELLIDNLDISENPITDPKCIYNLPRLKKLSLLDTGITKLDIAQLPQHLEHISVNTLSNMNEFLSMYNYDSRTFTLTKKIDFYRKFKA